MQTEAKPEEAPVTPPIEPCHHMEEWVNGLADGSLTGIARLYTRFHISTCLKCRTALLALEELRQRLNDLNHSAFNHSGAQETDQELTPARRAALAAAMEEIELLENQKSEKQKSA